MRTLNDFENWFLGKPGSGSSSAELPIVARFWNGGASTPYQMKKVTPRGAFIVDSDRWYPGTIIAMTLQYDPLSVKTPGPDERVSASVCMHAKVTALWPGGADVQFVFLNEQEVHRFKEFLAIAEAAGMQADAQAPGVQ